MSLISLAKIVTGLGPAVKVLEQVPTPLERTGVPTTTTQLVQPALTRLQRALRMMQLVVMILGLLGGPAAILQHVSTGFKVASWAVAVKLVADVYSAVDPMDLIESSAYGKSASDAVSQDAICWRLTTV